MSAFQSPPAPAHFVVSKDGVETRIRIESTSATERDWWSNLVSGGLDKAPAPTVSKSEVDEAANRQLLRKLDEALIELRDCRAVAEDKADPYRITSEGETLGAVSRLQMRARVAEGHVTRAEAEVTRLKGEHAAVTGRLAAAFEDAQKLESLLFDALDGKPVEVPPGWHRHSPWVRLVGRAVEAGKRPVPDEAAKVEDEKPAPQGYTIHLRWDLGEGTAEQILANAIRDALAKGDK